MSNKLYDLDINIYRGRNNNFNTLVKISVWNNLEVNMNDEFYIKIYSGCTCFLIF